MNNKYIWNLWKLQGSLNELEVIAFVDDLSKYDKYSKERVSPWNAIWVFL